MKFDPCQIQAIDAGQGYHLVLAPPGCGKTEILAEPIAKALERGVSPEDMLCLTFTNRASRGMRQRVDTRLDNPGVSAEIFIGNLHRFCSHYLFQNNIVPETVYIIDEDDCGEIISRLAPNISRRRNGDINRFAVNYITDLASYIAQRRLNHPEDVLPEGPGLLDRYNDRFLQHDFKYLYDVAARNYFSADDTPSNHEALIAALKYNQYKESHYALDFNDLLVTAYEHLHTHPEHKRYKWLQIDEVQDLNRLQLAIADELTAPGAAVMYLGDEQQAIFSFIGAKLDNLDLLRQRCSGNVLSLASNYRSPSYLLEVYNAYAHHVLGVNEHLLPLPFEDKKAEPLDLILTQSNDPAKEAARVEKMVKYYLSLSRDERLAILVSRNAQADSISEQLTNAGVNNFKISGTDMFRTASYKTLAALYSVIVNDFDMGAWTRLLFGLNCQSTQVGARELVYQMRLAWLTPSDLLRPKPYLQQFSEIYDSGEFIVFDTETTGLNLLEDDIVQIAAFKVSRGEKVPGSDFNIILHTDREIPPLLGDLPNPLIQEYASRRKHDRREGLRLFLDYVGNLPLVGHNVTYDYQMLRNNSRRYLGREVEFEVWDTLHMAKLVAPNLKKYTLAALIEEFGLQGENAHLADADIEATYWFLKYCMDATGAVKKTQDDFLSGPVAKRAAKRLALVSGLIAYIKKNLYLPISQSGRNIAKELSQTYAYLCESNLIEEIGHKFDVFLRYVESEWCNADTDTSLFDQLQAHITDLTSTINEGDLVNSDSIIEDRVFIMTIHKAKGLQFDNVVVLGANRGVFPFYATERVLASFDSTIEMKKAAGAMQKEDARKLYVAISRARKRLCVSCTKYNDFGYPAGLTPFMLPVIEFFNQGSKKSD